MKGVGVRAALMALGVALLVAGPMSSHAEARDVPSEKQTRLGLLVTATEAAALLAATPPGRALFIDIRTRGEVEYVGHPTGIDGHVPYAELSEFGDWDDKAGRYKVELNSRFGAGVARLAERKSIGKGDVVVLICRSGDRSARAANLLADLGYTRVFSVFDGFEGDLSKEGRRTVNGWRNAGLPWTYRLTREQAYRPAP